MATTAVLDNVQVGRLQETMRRAAQDRSAAVMQVEMEGTWNLAEGEPQYRSILNAPNAGPVEVMADFPPQFGGWGKAPSALQYCLYASTACFASTFALVAALEGVTLRSLRVKLSARLNMERFLGVGEAPVIEHFKWAIVADSDADDDTMERLRVLAEQRCPATWCLRNPISVESSVDRGR
ncbi:MAG: OsmC family protein [Bacillota bacterium]